MSEHPSADLFPELPAEQAQLAFARACRDRMVDRFSALDPEGAADEITKEYIEVTVAEALEDLRTPGAGDFFGRIGEENGDRWYIGRRHIENDAHDPVVVDWRAPIAAPFYRATHADPFGLAHRRRFTLAATGDAPSVLTAYLDEQLDDPDHDTAGSGIPDPVLAEIGAARTGAMREVVATIQAEQDMVIRAPLDQCLVVQGGPGTGKTAVGLHRAAFLLFEHRRRLVRDGVLVVGPNKVFLDYIGNVLPSLGERSVQQRTALDLCVPKVPVTGVDSVGQRRGKGSEEQLLALEAASTMHVKVPAEDLRVPIGARTLTITRDEIAEWLALALDSNAPVNKRRDSLKGLVQRDMQRRYDRDDVWEKGAELRAALTKSWPTQTAVKLVDQLLPGPGGKRRAWTVADQFLVDEANSLLVGTPFTYGHVVVDEAQDHSAVALRCIGRRSPSGSMTILGDLAQSTTPAGQQDWDEALRFMRATASEVAHLTIGYRVPAPILDVANRLLPHTGVTTPASRSVRAEGGAPVLTVVADDELAAAVAAEVRLVRHRHHNTGVVVPEALMVRIVAALDAAGLHATDRVHDLGHDDVPVFHAEAVKGLEFDGVVVVNPHEIFDGSDRGARLLYVAMTRAVQVLHFVSTAPFPAALTSA
ncbi:MAG: ATP-binding domain-containing protein [Actinomycetota bacterium]|nr:ATP-binding domain-containing protein [Actinomycetota bacterium]